MSAQPSQNDQADVDRASTVGKLAELTARRKAAENAGSEKAIAKQHAKGKMTARERILRPREHQPLPGPHRIQPDRLQHRVQLIQALRSRIGAHGAIEARRPESWVGPGRPVQQPGRGQRFGALLETAEIDTTGGAPWQRGHRRRAHTLTTGPVALRRARAAVTPLMRRKQIVRVVPLLLRQELLRRPMIGLPRVVQIHQAAAASAWRGQLGPDNLARPGRNRPRILRGAGPRTLCCVSHGLSGLSAGCQPALVRY